MLKYFFSALLSIVFIVSSSAHQADQSYVYLNIYKDNFGGVVEITLSDLEKVLEEPLPIDPASIARQDESDDYVQLIPELKSLVPSIRNYILEKLSIDSKDGPHGILFTKEDLLPIELGVFYRAHFELYDYGYIPEELEIKNELIAHADKSHTSAVIIGHHWKAGIINNESMISLAYTKNSGPQVLNLEKPSMWKGFLAMVKLGMWHIYIGLDHILFLVALLLPSVVRRKPDFSGNGFLNQWTKVSSFKSAFFYIIRIVTLFTIAHSITLSLAALNVVNLSSRIVESLIALSIGLAAFLIVKPLFKRSESTVAFGFGLFHGLGFASVLGEKGLGGEFMTLSLLGFNVGVELGQVLIICCIFPILFLLSRRSFYPKIMLLGVIFLIIISLYWFVERFFELDLAIDDYIAKVFRGIKYRLGLE